MLNIAYLYIFCLNNNSETDAQVFFTFTVTYFERTRLFSSKHLGNRVNSPSFRQLNKCMRNSLWSKVTC